MIYSQFLSLKNWCCFCCICCICGKCEKSTLFHAWKNCLSWHEIQNPRNPSILPKNRLKCLRRTFIPPRQKLALYGALKRAVKIQ